MARKSQRRTSQRPRRPVEGAGAQPGVAAASAAGPAARLSDEPLDDTPDTPLDAPDPIAHATPDVELAEAQLAVGRPDDAEEASDEELEAAAIADGRGSRGAEVVRAPARPGNRLVHFVQGSWRELQRVQWPDRRQVMQATAVVIGFVIVAGVFLGVSDLISSKVVTWILK